MNSDDRMGIHLYGYKIGTPLAIQRPPHFQILNNYSSAFYSGTNSREGSIEKQVDCTETLLSRPHSSHKSPDKPGEPSGTSTTSDYQLLSENTAVKCTERESRESLQDGVVGIEEEGVESAPSPARPHVSSQTPCTRQSKQGLCAGKLSSSSEKQVLDRRRSKSSSAMVTPDTSEGGATVTGKSGKRKVWRELRTFS